MAIEEALAHFEPEPTAEPDEVVRQTSDLVARVTAAFDGTVDALGHPQPVHAPERD